MTRIQWSDPAFRAAYYLLHQANNKRRANARYATIKRKRHARSRLDQLIMGMGETPHRFGVFGEVHSSGYRHNGRRVYFGYTL